jgi:hypothetical protein
MDDVTLMLEIGLDLGTGHRVIVHGEESERGH